MFSKKPLALAAAPSVNLSPTFKPDSFNKDDTKDVPERCMPAIIRTGPIFSLVIKIHGAIRKKKDTDYNLNLPVGYAYLAPGFEYRLIRN
jgi:hypothetical protein